MCDGLFDSCQEAFEPCNLRLQHVAMILQRADLVELGIFDDGPYLFQRESKLAKEQNLLEPQQVGFPIQPVSRCGAVCRPQQPQCVVVVQRPHCDVCHIGDLPHGVLAHFDLQASIMNHDVT